MTDVLGVCTSWGDGVCVVQREEGPIVIAVADIVAGKPVPPRPSPRHRVGPVEAQRRAFALFADLETEEVGAWTLRHSPTTTARRANSVLAFEPSGVDDDYARVVRFYEGHAARPIAAVLPDSAEDTFFRAQGWGLESHDADTDFLIASVARARRALPSSSAVVELVETTPALVTARVTEADGVVASGVAAYGDDWVGFRSVEVHPDRRREGLGLAVMAALLEWGAEQGATTAYLQMLGDNAPALALYAGLGFREHHRYRYLAPPG